MLRLVSLNQHNYNYDMNIGDWVLTISVCVALVMGVLSLWQTKNLQRKQSIMAEEIRQKELRLSFLDETIDWATEIYRGSIDPDIELYRNLQNADGDAEKEHLAENRHRERLLSFLLSISSKSEYFSSVAALNISRELGQSIDELLFYIDLQIEILRGAITGADPVTTTRIGVQTELIRGSAREVVTAAAKLKPAILKSSNIVDLT